MFAFAGGGAGVAADFGGAPVNAEPRGATDVGIGGKDLIFEMGLRTIGTGIIQLHQTKM